MRKRGSPIRSESVESCTFRCPHPYQPNLGSYAVMASSTQRPDVVPVKAKLWVCLVRLDVVKDHGSGDAVVRLTL